MTIERKSGGIPWPALLRLAVYALVVLSPLILSSLGEKVENPDNTPLFSAGKSAGLLGFAILAMQFVISARIKWAEKPFGLDRVMRFHKWMGVTGALLILSHPINMVLGGRSWRLIYSLDLPWVILIAKAALVLLLIQGIISLYRLAIGLEFQTWRTAHDIIAPVILGVGGIHGLIIGEDLKSAPMRILFSLLATVAAAGLVSTRILGPRRRRARARSVSEVTQETHNVWTVKIAPPAGGKRLEYLPGQFHFLTLYRAGGLPVEEHPFTISSSPSQEGFVTSTIKESGDYTSTIGKTKPGDHAAIEGPFGRFSYVLHPEENDLVLIAGGIGITPLMSMIRHMRDTGAAKNVLLLYANRAESDIVFRKELDAIRAGGKPRLTVVHVLDKGGPEWKGEGGRVDEERIRRVCGDLSGKAFYLCGPPPMMAGIRRTLVELGVPCSRIHYEFFSL
jgi:predicted ferric reductase